MLVVYAGTVGAPRLLLDVLKEAHADRVLAYQSQQAYRVKMGVPLVDDFDVEEERTRLQTMLDALDEYTPNLGIIELGHMAGSTQLLSSRQKDPGEWAAPAGLDGIRIEPIFPSARETRTLKRAIGDAVNSGDPESIHTAEDAMLLAGIGGLTGLRAIEDGREIEVGFKRLDEKDCEAFRACGLHVWLLSAVLFLWGLDRGKAWRSGVAQPAT